LAHPISTRSHFGHKLGTAALFRLAHLSDPHLPAPATLGPASQWLSKRTLSRLAWRRKRLEHDPAVLALITADIAAHAPDHIAVTGDLTNFSTDAEYEAARAWLGSLGNPANVTLSPGNHDALVADGHAARLTTLHPWLGDSPGPFPHVRRRGPVAIINLCSALPTPPLLATGLLGDDQLANLDQALETSAQEALFRVVMLHHPPLAGVVSRRKSLTDGEKLRAVLARRGADLILHGHGHEAAFNAIEGPSGPIPALGAPSASAVIGGHHPAARWNMIDISDAGALTVIARGVNESGSAIVELGRYNLAAISAVSA
jgi:3',5'-cyclic AMP phosphodiesterase CpdA